MTPRISDRCSEAEDIVGMKLMIVGDEVVINLGTDEHIAPGVVADSKASVQQEVGTVQVCAAASRGEWARSDPIEEQGHQTGASHDVTVGLGCKSVRVDCIRVDDDRPIELEIVVNALVVAENAFDVDAAVFCIQVLKKDAGIGSAL